MKEAIRARYDKTNTGSYIIHSRVQSCRALFSRFDYSTSFSKRDLNEDFADYLFECCDEIGNSASFVIRIEIPESEQDQYQEKRVMEAVRNYFVYTGNVAVKKIRQERRRMMTNILISLILLGVIYFVDRFAAIENSIMYLVFNEGLSIAVWVLLWPLFSEFLFHLKENRSVIRDSRRLREAEIEFGYYRD
jgi:hypothetical protein